MLTVRRPTLHRFPIEGDIEFLREIGDSVSIPSYNGGGRPAWPPIQLTNLSPTNDRTVLYYNSATEFSAPTGANVNTVLEVDFSNYDTDEWLIHSTAIMFGGKRSASGGNDPSMIWRVFVGATQVADWSYTFSGTAQIASQTRTIPSEYNGQPLSSIRVRFEGNASSGGGGPNNQRTAVPTFCFFGWNNTARRVFAVGAGSLGGYFTESPPDENVVAHESSSVLPGYLLGEDVVLGNEGRISMHATSDLTLRWPPTMLRPLRLRTVIDTPFEPKWDGDTWLSTRRWTVAHAAKRAFGWDTNLHTNPERCNVIEWDTSVDPPLVTIKNHTEALDEVPTETVVHSVISPNGEMLVLFTTIPQPMASYPPDGNMIVYLWDGNRFIKQSTSAWSGRLDFQGEWATFSHDGLTLWIVTRDAYYVLNTQWSRHIVWVYDVSYDPSPPQLSFRTAWQIPNRPGASNTWEDWSPRMVRFNNSGTRFWVMYFYLNSTQEDLENFDNWRAESYIYIHPAVAFDRYWRFELAPGSEMLGGGGQPVGDFSIWRENQMQAGWNHDDSGWISFARPAGTTAQHQMHHWDIKEYSTPGVIEARRSHIENLWHVGAGSTLEWVKIQNYFHYRIPGTNAIVGSDYSTGWASLDYARGKVALRQVAGKTEYAHRPQWEKPTIPVETLFPATLDGEWLFWVGSRFSVYNGWRLVNTSRYDVFALVNAVGTLATRALVERRGKLGGPRLRAQSRLIIYPLGSLLETFRMNALDSGQPAQDWTSDPAGTLTVNYAGDASGDALAVSQVAEHTWDKARTAQDAQVAAQVTSAPYATMELLARVDTPDRIALRVTRNGYAEAPALNTPTHDPDHGPLAGTWRTLNASVPAVASMNGRFLAIRGIPHGKADSTWNYHWYLYDYSTSTQYELMWDMFGPYNHLPVNAPTQVVINSISDNGVLALKTDRIEGDILGYTTALFARLHDGAITPYAEPIPLYGGSNSCDVRVSLDGTMAVTRGVVNDPEAEPSNSFGTDYIRMSRFALTPGVTTHLSTHNVELPIEGSTSSIGNAWSSISPDLNKAMGFMRSSLRVVVWDGNDWVLNNAGSVSSGLFQVRWSEDSSQFIWLGSDGNRRLFHYTINPATHETEPGLYHLKLVPASATQRDPNDPPGNTTALTYNLLEPDWENQRVVFISRDTVVGSFFGRIVHWVNLATESASHIAAWRVPFTESGTPSGPRNVLSCAWRGRQVELLTYGNTYDDTLGVTSDRTNHAFRIPLDVRSEYQLELRRYDTGGATTLDSADLGVALPDATVMAMLDVEGTDAKGAAWSVDDPGPTGWDVEGSIPSSPARPMGFRSVDGSLKLDHFAVGVNGYPAPYIFDLDLNELRMSAASGLAINARVASAGSLLLEAQSSLSIIGEVVEPGDEAVLHLAATSALSIASARAQLATLGMSAHAALTIQATVPILGRLTLVAQGVLTPIEARRSAIGKLNIPAVGTWAASALRARQALLLLPAVGALSIEARASFAVAHWQAVGALAPRGTLVPTGPARASWRSAGTLAVTPGPLTLSGHLALVARARARVNARSVANVPLDSLFAARSTALARPLTARQVSGAFRALTWERAWRTDHAAPVHIASTERSGFVTAAAARYLIALAERGAAFRLSTRALWSMEGEYEAIFDPAASPVFTPVTPDGSLYAVDLLLLVIPASEGGPE